MVRKSINLCIALCLSIVLILPVGGLASASGSLSTDTIVTEENVNQVIEYLGLDPEDLKKLMLLFQMNPLLLLSGNWNKPLIN